MIELEKLKAVTHIVTHDNCADGTASAMILHDVLPEAKISFMQYNTKEYAELKAEPGMMFCDFSPDKKRVKEFLDAGALVLDHHKFAKSLVMPFVEAGQGVFADEEVEPGVSGATLAYREVWDRLTSSWIKDSGMPRDMWRTDAICNLAKLAGIRDTWQKSDPAWFSSCAQGEALRFWSWPKIQATPPDQWATVLLAIGPTLFERNMAHVKKCIKGASRFISNKGRRVVCFEGLKPTSDAAEELGDSADLVIGLAFFAEHGVPTMAFSTRTRGKFNCGLLATAHGGGGHTKAAGFSLYLKPGDPQPYELAKQVVNLYESVEDKWLELAEPLMKENEQAVKADLPPPHDLAQEYERLLEREGKHTEWSVRFNRYQRDNMVWLLDAIGYPHNEQRGVLEPINYLNTGDWVGEIATQLDYHLGVGKPNQTYEELRRDVFRYIEQCCTPRDAIDL